MTIPNISSSQQEQLSQQLQTDVNTQQSTAVTKSGNKFGNVNIKGKQESSSNTSAKTDFDAASGGKSEKNNNVIYAALGALVISIISIAFIVRK